jgi:hypothetical protein
LKFNFPNINATNNSNVTNDNEMMFLHRIRMFSGLSDQQLKSIEKGEEVWFEAGDKIIAEGEHGTFYVLLDGKADVITLYVFIELKNIGYKNIIYA